VFNVQLDRRRFLLAGTALVAGCGGPANAPVDAGRARAALREALESWKHGEPADRLQAASPPVYVIDPDWQAGATLKDYSVLDDGIAMDAHLHVHVRLTLRLTSGSEAAREVTFVVSTAPNLCVSRKIF
jgi:hypothetical protein